MKRICAAMTILLLTGCAAKEDSSSIPVIYAERPTESITETVPETAASAQSTSAPRTVPPTETFASVLSTEGSSSQIPGIVTGEPGSIVGTWQWNRGFSEESQMIFAEDGSMIMRMDNSSLFHLDENVFWVRDISYPVTVGEDGSILVRDDSQTILYLTSREGNPGTFSGTFDLHNCWLRQEYDLLEDTTVYLEKGMFFLQQSGAYSVDGNTLTLMRGSNTISAEFEIEDDVLSITMEDPEGGEPETEYLYRVVQS